MPVSSLYITGDPAISFSLLDNGGRAVAERGAEQEFYAASTIKLAVLLAAMRQVDVGGRALDDELKARHTFTSAAPGAGEFTFDPDEVDERFPGPGTGMRLGDVLDVMITRSSNEATNMVVEMIGLDAVNDTIADCGLASTEMKRLIGDLAARDDGYTHRTSAADLARLTLKIVTGEFTTPATTRLMISALERQEYSFIASGLPTGVRWGSKSGWVTGINHDVAFIGTPGTPATLYLAVCTRGYDETQGKEAIAAMTSSLVTPLLSCAGAS